MVVRNLSAMRTQLLLVATTALLLLPAAQAQDVGIKNPEVSTPTKLYFHVINVQDMPINTQVPDPKFADDSSFGAGTNTLRCLDPYTGDVGGTGQGTGGTTSQVYHTNYGYSSPSYVEYDYQNANGEPRTHPERGISYDAIFDQGAPFTITWYVQIFNGNAQLNTIPTPVPGFVVAASMRAGDAISVDDKAYDSGPSIAHGNTKPAILVTDAAQGPKDMQGQPHDQVTYEGVTEDGAHLFKFTIPMSFDADRILRATGFNVRIDMYMDNQACNSPAQLEKKEYIMPGTVTSYTDAAHRPTMDFNIMNPIRLEYLHPQFVGDDLVVHTSMNSAWGNYDVGEVNAMTPQVTDEFISVKIEGPSPATSLAKAALVQRFHEHYHHQEAVDVTYVWPYKTDKASNGLYTVFVEFKNDQDTATASGVAQFEIGKGTVIGCGGIQESSQKQQDDCAETIQVDGKTASKDAPGLPMVGALAALGAAAVALRRRKA